MPSLSDAEAAYEFLRAITRGLEEPRCGECFFFRETSAEVGTCRGTPPRPIGGWSTTPAWAVVKKEETGCIAFVPLGAVTKLRDAARDDEQLARLMGWPAELVGRLRAKMRED